MKVGCEIPPERQSEWSLKGASRRALTRGAESSSADEEKERGERVREAGEELGASEELFSRWIAKSASPIPAYRGTEA